MKIKKSETFPDFLGWLWKHVDWFLNEGLWTFLAGNQTNMFMHALLSSMTHETNIYVQENSERAILYCMSMFYAKKRDLFKL